LDQIRALREQGALIPGGNLAFGIVVNRFLKPALTIRGNKNRIRGMLDEPSFRARQRLRASHDPQRAPGGGAARIIEAAALVMICGILIASAALLLILLRS
jgi:hypothetical protein